VAPGHDGRRQGPVRVHLDVHRGGLHRRPQEGQRPVLVINGEADQIVPCATSGPRAVKLVQHGTLKTYPGFPHGMPTTHADTINTDLLAFLKP
jgi:pimeloyl-ACP methyl ester carboxylesterase